MAEKVSRKEFLSILGYGGLFLVGTMIGLGAFSRRNANSDKKQNQAGLLPEAFAATTGSWSLGPETLCLAVHAALLRNGKVLYVAGSGDDPRKAAGPFKAGLLDPTTNSQTDITLSEDLFCGHHCQLANGNILFAGGTKTYKGDSEEFQYQGLNCAYVFDVATESFVKVSSMAAGRWYPTMVCLNDGQAFTVNGLDEFGSMNDLTEVYNVDNNTWTIKFDPKSDLTYCVGSTSSLLGAGSPCYGGPKNGTNPPVFLYPRMHLLPNGLVAVCGQKKELRTWNPQTNVWSTYGDMIGGPRSYGTTVLLPLQNTKTEMGQVLVVGGSPNADGPAITGCEIVTPDSDGSLRTRSTYPMRYARRYHIPVILPDGRVFIVGGTTQGNLVQNAVYIPEIFDPTTERWRVLPAATVPRMYHSVALLLPDGRVWTASTSYSTSKGELRTEIFSPSYITGDRPVIPRDPLVNNNNHTIRIPANDTSAVQSVSLVRASTTTHHFNTDQRLIWLPILNRDKFNVYVQAPLNKKLAPPGFYLVHILNSQNIPSEGKFVMIS